MRRREDREGREGGERERWERGRGREREERGRVRKRGGEVCNNFHNIIIMTSNKPLTLIIHPQTE